MSRILAFAMIFGAASFATPFQVHCQEQKKVKMSSDELAEWIEQRFGSIWKQEGITPAPLANDATDNLVRAILIVNPQRYAAVVPKIEFAQITMQVLLSAVLIDALHTTLEDGEVAFKGVGVCGTADVFASAMVDGAMAGKFIGDLGIDQAFVRHQV